MVGDHRRAGFGHRHPVDVGRVLEVDDRADPVDHRPGRQQGEENRDHRVGEQPLRRPDQHQQRRRHHQPDPGAPGVAADQRGVDDRQGEPAPGALPAARSAPGDELGDEQQVGDQQDAGERHVVGERGPDAVVEAAVAGQELAQPEGARSRGDHDHAVDQPPDLPLAAHQHQGDRQRQEVERHRQRPQAALDVERRQQGEGEERDVGGEDQQQRAGPAPGLAPAPPADPGAGQERDAQERVRQGDAEDGPELGGIEPEAGAVGDGLLGPGSGRLPGVGDHWRRGDGAANLRGRAAWPRRACPVVRPSERARV